MPHPRDLDASETEERDLITGRELRFPRHWEIMTPHPSGSFQQTSRKIYKKGSEFEIVQLAGYSRISSTPGPINEPEKHASAHHLPSHWVNNNRLCDFKEHSLTFLTLLLELLIYHHLGVVRSVGFSVTCGNTPTIKRRSSIGAHEVLRSEKQNNILFLSLPIQS